MKIFLLLGMLMLSSGCVSNLFYYPDNRIYQTPKQKGLPFEAVSFISRDGTVLSGWFIPATRKPVGTVIHFHGNAQNMTAHFSFVDWLPSEGFNVFTFDYRGYGLSQGKPNRQGVFEDGIAAIEYVQKRKDIDANAIIVFGQSLGGANALAVLGEKHFDGIRAVAIDSAFYSYRSIVRDKIGEIPLLWTLKWPLSFLMIGNRHSPGPVAGNISPTPLLVIHGTADGVIPYHNGQQIFEKAHDPKQFWTVDLGQHTSAFSNPVFRKRLIQFFTSALENGRPL